MNANELSHDDEFMATLLGEFLDESQTHLATLNENLLALDEYVQSLQEGQSSDVDEDRLNEMFRAAHSLKGLSAMLSLDDINRLTHRTENVLDAARRHQLEVTQEVVDVILQSVDHLTAMIQCLKDGQAIDVDYLPTVEAIQNLLESHGVAATKTRTLADELAEEGLTEGDIPGGAEFYDHTMAQVAARERDLHVPVSQNATSNQETEKALSEFERLQDDRSIPEKYVAIFLDESAGCLDQMTEVAGSDDAANHLSQLMRLCHQLKGSAAAAGFLRAARLTHQLEDALAQATLHPGTSDSQLFETFMQGVDALRSHIESYGQDGVADMLTPAFDLLLRYTNVDREEPQNRTADRDQPSPLTGPAVTTLHRPSDITAAIPANLSSDSLNRNSMGQPQPLASSHEDQTGHVSHPSTTVASTRQPTSQDATARSAVDDNADADTLDRAKSDSSSSSSNGKGKPTETIRVDIDRLDQLMNLTGQLVINKARFGRLGNRLKALTSVKQASHSLVSVTNLIERAVADIEVESDRLDQNSLPMQLLDSFQQMRSLLEVVQREVVRVSQARAIVNELAEAVHQLDRVADGIQKSVMDTRMLPIGPLFGRFKRVIRDVTRVNGKDVRLVVHGEKTELDKRMIDEIGDPLIHMIRNAADHGIETSDQRVDAGKTAWGTITLNAFHRGNGILIQISDDGRGIDPDKIRAKALSNGLINEQDAERMSSNQLLQLIWEPGFSTAEKVTEVSGRGVGMDIVRSKIEQLNGTVELESTLGSGTTFTIKLPLTMAILPSLLAKIDGDVFAIPVESVVDIVRVEEDELSTIQGLPTATVRGRAISVVDLSDLFAWSVPPRERETNPGERKTLVIVGAERRELGVVVAGLLGEEDIVIKSLSENYRSVEGIAGASILGDGRVALILDVNSLLEMACRRTSRPNIFQGATAS